MNEDDIDKSVERSIDELSGINVDAALNKLKELAFESIKENGFISEEQLQEYELLTDEIKELARQRDAIHDALEVETIKTSKQRTAVQLLPGKFMREMQEAVLAARGINEGEMKSLNGNLNALKKESTEHEETIKQLTTDNIKMKPECDLIRKEHDEIIAQLNKRMSVKSNKQIVLNETKDKLRIVKEQTAEIDVGLLNLEDDLNEDRAEGDKERTKLKDETQQTEQEISEQTEQNGEQKKKIDDYTERSMDKSAKIDEQRKDFGRLENSMMRLEMDAMQLSDKIERERRSNEQVFEKNTKLRAEIESEQAKYHEKIEEMQKKLDRVKGELQTAEQENAEISHQKDIVFLQKEQAHIKKNQHTGKVKESANYYAMLKDNVAKQTDFHSAIEQKNNEIEAQMETLIENHKATKELYETQIEELNTTLTQEHHERVKTQQQRDESEKVLDDFTSKHSDYMNAMTSDLNKATSEHQKLTDKSQLLVRNTKLNRKAIDTLHVKLEVAQSSLVGMRSSLEQDIQRISANIEFLRKENKNKQEHYDDIGPRIEEIRAESEARDLEYNEQKLAIVAIRNKEKSTAEKKNRTKMLIEKLHKPMVERKEKTKTAREEGLKQLQSQSDERNHLEAQIYCITHRLEKIIEENLVMDGTADALADEIVELKADMRAHASHQQQMCLELQKLHVLFMKSWARCVELEQASSEHDHEVLQGISEIQKDTKERSEVLSGIASNLKSELDSLTGFLENVQERRPKDTRDAKRRLTSQQRKTPILGRVGEGSFPAKLFSAPRPPSLLDRGSSMLPSVRPVGRPRVVARPVAMAGPGDVVQQKTVESALDPASSSGSVIKSLPSNQALRVSGQ